MCRVWLTIALVVSVCVLHWVSANFLPDWPMWWPTNAILCLYWLFVHVVYQLHSLYSLPTATLVWLTRLSIDIWYSPPSKSASSDIAEAGLFTFQGQVSPEKGIKSIDHTQSILKCWHANRFQLWLMIMAQAGLAIIMPKGFRLVEKVRQKYTH